MAPALLLALLIGLLDHGWAASVDSEQQALLAFKHGLTNSSALSSWGSDVCTWKGVYCSPQGAVVGLNLRGLNLQGTIAPNSLSKLSELQNLDLAVNQLSGAIPDDWNQGRALPALLSLNLTHNLIHAVPADWGAGGSQALERVWLTSNTLDAFPAGLSFRQLASLSVVYNKITGSIPGDWNVNSHAKVFVLPQAGNGSGPCGPVPGSPSFFYDSGSADFPLTNNLGSCMVNASNCTHASTPVPLSGFNLYDVARQGGATAWDTAVLNPSIDPIMPSTAMITLPCYKYGSPAGNYLGGDMAYQRPAWGSVEGAAAVNSLPPPQRQEQDCFLASGEGSYWQVDLGNSMPLRMVALALGEQGLLNATITVGDNPYPGGQPCASVDTSRGPAPLGPAESSSRTAVLCNTAGQYLMISGEVLHLCSVEVYPPVSSASLHKSMTVTKVQQNLSFGPTPLTDQGNLVTSVYNASYNGPLSGSEQAEAVDKAAIALDLSYIAPIAGAYLWGDSNVGEVLVSNSSLNASGGVVPGALPCTRGFGSLESSAAVKANTTSGVRPIIQVAFYGPNNSTLDCGGAVGRYLVLVGGGMQMEVDGIEVYLSQQPGGIVPFPDPPSPPPPSSPPPAPQSPPSSDCSGCSSSSSSTGAIVGGVMGGVALMAVLGGGTWWLLRRRRQQAGAVAKTRKQAGQDVVSGKHILPPASKGDEPAALLDQAAVKPLSPSGNGSLNSANGGNRANEDAEQVALPASQDPLLKLLITKLRTQRQLQQESGAAAPGPASSPASGSASRAAAASGSPLSCSQLPALETQPLPAVNSSRPGGASLSVDMRLWMVNFEDLDIQRIIGEGSYGRVYLARWRETTVAVKLLLNTGVDVGDMEAATEQAISLSNPILANLEQEASLVAALRHPNIVSFLGLCLSPPCILSEYCSRGSLLDVLRGARQSPAKAEQLDWSRRLNMALDAAKGILYLHSFTPPIIHRDLKSPNLLVDAHWRVKCCDFNLAKICESGSSLSSMVTSNPRWLAPEVLRGQSATFASDVFSYGVILWELLTWELPWGMLNPWQIVTLRQEGKSLQFPEPAELPGGAGSFVGLEVYIALTHSCWAEDPAERPQFAEIILQLRHLLSRAIQARTGKQRAQSL